MQGLVVHHGPLPDGSVGSDVILPSPTLTPTERVEIYQGMYPLRMQEAIETDYPGVAHFLGAEGFAELVSAYTEVHPSTSYTLNRLGDHLPGFIAERRSLRHRPFLTDLARLELAMTEAFDAEESPVLGEAGLAALDPERLAFARLSVVASLRLVEVRYNVDDYLTSVREAEDGGPHSHPKPKLTPTSIAVFRRNYGVCRLPVSPAAYSVLEDLKAGRGTVGEIVTAALKRRGKRAASPDDFSRWFRSWTSEGMLSTLAEGSRGTSS
jgi:hypothetical protein